MTDNELIHEFMGYDWKTERFEWRIGATTQMTIKHLEHYQTSWNWLMPVVENIIQLGFYPQILTGEDGNEVMIHNEMLSYKRSEDTVIIANKPVPASKPMIEVVYEAVVEFIKWYNLRRQDA